jgi:hypothetical protein
MANEPEKIPASKYSSSRQFTKPDLPVLSKVINAPQVKPDNGNHYCVLCNLPHGLICVVDDKRIKLKGSANYIMPSKTRKFKGLMPQEAIFGASMNFVDRDFWDKWVAKMTDREAYPSGYAPITNGQIIWHQHQSEATLIRRETERVKSGFEQLNPEEHGVKRDDDAPATGSVPRVTE